MSGENICILLVLAFATFPLWFALFSALLNILIAVADRIRHGPQPRGEK